MRLTGNDWRKMRGQGSAPIPNPFPRSEAGATVDAAVILIAEFLADQVAVDIVTEERARRVTA